MKFKLLFLVLLICAGKPGLAQTTRITSFDELMKSLISGETVRVVIHYAKCRRLPDQKDTTTIPNAVAGMNIDTYEYFSPGAAHNKSAFVVFSSSKLIQNPIGKGFVFNYGKIRINDDNTVQVTAKYIHPKSFKVIMDEVFIGKLNNGENDEGINLFK